MRSAFLICFFTVAGLAGEIERMEVTVGRHVISELQLEEELRVTAFINEKPVVSDREQRRLAAERLIQQALIMREITLSQFSAEVTDAANNLLRRVESLYGDARKYQAALTRYELTEDILRRHFVLQVTTLQFVDYRFRNTAGDDRTDAALNTWLEQARKQVAIVYVDKDLEKRLP